MMRSELRTADCGASRCLPARYIYIDLCPVPSVLVFSWPLFYLCPMHSNKNNTNISITPL
ncbi:hypothetical protein BJX65DRAFT_240105 [Aspergillus insuetus]